MTIDGDIEITVVAHDDPRLVAAGDLLDSEQVAKMLGVTLGSLRVLRSRGNSKVAGMPAPLRQISGRPVWSRLEIETWLAGRAT
jgi:hypothetical protein